MTPSQVLTDIATQRGFTVEQIRRRTRPLELTSARRAIARRLRAMGLSLTEIGALMGRHHASIYSLLLEGEKRARRHRQKMRWHRELGPEAKAELLVRRRAAWRAKSKSEKWRVV
jgi:hypothetical protein